jgi:hypothetical protein
VAAGALLLFLGLGVATHATGFGGHAMHGLLGGDEGALFLAEGGVALGTGDHALGRGGMVADRTVLVLLFVLLVVEGHGVDESRLGGGLGGFGHEQEEIGLTASSLGASATFLKVARTEASWQPAHSTGPEGCLALAISMWQDMHFSWAWSLFSAKERLRCSGLSWAWHLEQLSFWPAGAGTILEDW